MTKTFNVYVELGLMVEIPVYAENMESAEEAVLGYIDAGKFDTAFSSEIKAALQSGAEHRIAYDFTEEVEA